MAEVRNLFIPLILGTAREGRRSEAPAKFVLEILKQKGVETILVDPRDYQLEFKVVDSPNETTKKWQETAARADGFVIISPEYNHGYPAALKALLDELYTEYNYKPVAIAGVSTGVLGGGRMVEQLRLVAIELKMIPVREAVYFAKAKDLNLEESTPRVEKMLDELIWFAQVLKDPRVKRQAQKV